MSKESSLAIAPEVCADIEARLARVAGEDGVRLLMAVESGSRAWAFHRLTAITTYAFSTYGLAVTISRLSRSAMWSNGLSSMKLI